VEGPDVGGPVLRDDEEVFLAWRSISSSHCGKNEAEMCFTASSRNPSTPVVSRYHLPQARDLVRTSWL